MSLEVQLLGNNNNKILLQDTVLAGSVRDGDGVAPSAAVSWMVLLVPASVLGVAVREQKKSF